MSMKDWWVRRPLAASAAPKGVAFSPGFGSVPTNHLPRIFHETQVNCVARILSMMQGFLLPSRGCYAAYVMKFREDDPVLGRY